MSSTKTSWNRSFHILFDLQGKSSSAGNSNNKKLTWLEQQQISWSYEKRGKFKPNKHWKWKSNTYFAIELIFIINREKIAAVYPFLYNLNQICPGAPEPGARTPLELGIYRVKISKIRKISFFLLLQYFKMVLVFIDLIFKTADFILLFFLQQVYGWNLLQPFRLTQKVFFMRLESFVLVNGDISAHLGAADSGFPRLKTLWFFQLWGMD